MTNLGMYIVGSTQQEISKMNLTNCQIREDEGG